MGIVLNVNESACKIVTMKLMMLEAVNQKLRDDGGDTDTDP